MRPQSVVVLIFCILGALASFLMGLFLDLGWMVKGFGPSFVKNLGPLIALSFGVYYFLQSQPKLLDCETWTVREDIQGPLTHTDVWIKIPKKIHGKGRYPKVDFIKYGELMGPNTDLCYRIDSNGDIYIHPDANSFLSPKAVSVRVSM